MPIPPIPPGPDAIARKNALFAITNMAGRQRRVAALGDSITANNHLTTSTSTLQSLLKSSRGYMTFAEMLSKRAWYWDETLNFGVAGDTSTMILARVPNVIAAAPSACVVLAGVNDGPGSASPPVPIATTKSNLKAIWTQLAAAGILVLVIPILPASAWTGSTTTNSQRRAIQQVNNWIKETVPTLPNCILVDPTSLVIDNTTAAGNQGGMIGGQTTNGTNYSLDGLHPAQRGAFWIGYMVAQALSAYFNLPLYQGLQSALDVYNATDNPSGSLLSTAIMTATTGGTLGTGASGVAPSGMVFQRSFGTVAVATGSFIQATMLNGQPLNKFRIAMTAPSGSTARDSMTLAQNMGVTPGDVVYLEADVDISGITADSFLGMRLQMVCSDGTKTYTYSVADPDTSPASMLFPNFACSVTLRTPKFTVPANVASIYCSFEVFLVGAVTNAGVTVDISRLAGRKVIA